MFHKYRSVTFLLGLIVTAPLYGQKQPGFSRFVVAGDSLSAGYQNSQLIDSGQIHGYANVIAAQAGVDLSLPLLPPPGYPQIQIQGGMQRGSVESVVPSPGYGGGDSEPELLGSRSDSTGGGRGAPAQHVDSVDRQQ